LSRVISIIWNKNDDPSLRVRARELYFLLCVRALGKGPFSGVSLLPKGLRELHFQAKAQSWTGAAQIALVCAPGLAGNWKLWCAGSPFYVSDAREFHWELFLHELDIQMSVAHTHELLFSSELVKIFVNLNT
jgi:hypothetical protein